MRTLIAATVLGMLAVSCSETTGPENDLPLDAPDYAIRWGPNERIVFSSGRGGAPQIYIMNADGTNEVAVTDATDFPMGAHSPALSPNGSLVAFVSDGRIWVMFANGQWPRQLTNAFGTDTDPSWSPDGQMIAFARTTSSGKPSDTEIHWVTLDGLTEQQVTNDWSLSAYDPVWTHDGLGIAFERGGDIYSVFASCQNCSTAGNSPFLIDARDPVWSPDGTQIAFIHRQTPLHDYELYIADAGNVASRTQITFDAAVEANPTWSPGGTQIAFDTDRHNIGWLQRDVWKLRLSDMRPVRLTSANLNFDNETPSWRVVPTRYQ